MSKKSLLVNINASMRKPVKLKGTSQFVNGHSITFNSFIAQKSPNGECSCAQSNFLTAHKIICQSAMIN